VGEGRVAGLMGLSEDMSMLGGEMYQYHCEPCNKVGSDLGRVKYWYRIKIAKDGVIQ
jgi:hypothetical protein